jgi:hypothetical protein
LIIHRWGLAKNYLQLSLSLKRHNNKYKTHDSFGIDFILSSFMSEICWIVPVNCTCLFFTSKVGCIMIDDLIMRANINRKLVGATV